MMIVTTMVKPMTRRMSMLPNNTAKMKNAIIVNATRHHAKNKQP